MKLILGDCLEVLKTLEADSIDACVTDPPYGLSFMGKRWDYDVPSVDVWREVMRVLKPGAHLLSFGGTRTYHRMVVNIEDAGFEIRDQIQWLYGSGFPKSLDVSKAIDKAAGVQFDARPASGVGFMTPDGKGGYNTTKNQLTRAGESTDAAKQWDGWGTALKPANEPIVVARKPLSEKTVAANVLKWGTGALNIERCRVGETVETWPKSRSYAPGQIQPGGVGETQKTGNIPNGRWPANLIFDEEAGKMLDEQSGGASRFFYAAKASRKERGEGNNHPTVKPISLMRYLVRLVTPPGGIVMDPFMGSGTTGIAAKAEGFGFVGIEREPEYMKIAEARIAAAGEDLLL